MLALIPRTLCRCFTSSIPKAPPLLTEDEATLPVLNAGGYWDPASIERRVGRQRRPAPLNDAGLPMSRSGLCRGAPSEEDVYLEAGAPGYGENAVERKAWSSTPTVVGVATDSTNTGFPAVALPHTQLAALEQLGQLVRVSSGVVPKKSMPYFLQQWTILALPAYKALSGCVSARLLVGEKSSEPVEELIGTRAGINSVVVITEWKSAEALAAASESQVYTNAMKQILGNFRGTPVVNTYGQEEKYAWVVDGKAPEKRRNEDITVYF